MCINPMDLTCQNVYTYIDRMSVMENQMAKFSVEDLEEFQRLKRRQRQLVHWRESIKEDLARLKEQQRHQEDELASVEEVLGNKYQALEGKLELFTLSDVPDSALQIAEGKKKADKREVIKKRDWDREKHRILKNNN